MKQWNSSFISAWIKNIKISVIKIILKYLECFSIGILLCLINKTKISLKFISNFTSKWFLSIKIDISFISCVSFFRNLRLQFKNLLFRIILIGSLRHLPKKRSYFYLFASMSTKDDLKTRKKIVWCRLFWSK